MKKEKKEIEKIEILNEESAYRLIDLFNGQEDDQNIAFEIIENCTPNSVTMVLVVMKLSGIVSKFWQDKAPKTCKWLDSNGYKVAGHDFVSFNGIFSSIESKMDESIFLRCFENNIKTSLGELYPFMDKIKFNLELKSYDRGKNKTK